MKHLAPIVLLALLTPAAALAEDLVTVNAPAPRFLLPALNPESLPVEALEERATRALWTRLRFDLGREQRQLLDSEEGRARALATEAGRRVLREVQGDRALGQLGPSSFVGAAARDRGSQALLLSFSASWCGPCQREMPYLQALLERYRARGLRLLMVSIDETPERQDAMRALIARHQVTFPVLTDPSGIATRKWVGSTPSLPTVFLLRRDGTVALVERGYSQELSQVIEGAIEGALGAPAKAPPAAASGAGH